MALNIDTLKNPKMLAVLGVAIVGGIFVASKINAKRKAQETPIEVPTAQYAVENASDVAANDEISRKLTDAQQKYADLEQQAKEADNANAQRLQDLNAGFASERTAFEQRLADREASLGNQYTTQLNALQQQIAALQQQKAIQITQGPLGGSTAPQAPVTAQPTAPTAPAIPQPVPRPIEQQPPTARVPDSAVQVPGGFAQDCNGVGPLPADSPTDFSEAGIKAWIEAWRNRTGSSAAAGTWRAVWFALGGATGKANLRTWETLYLSDAWLGNLNTTRRAHGLKALNINEINNLRFSIRNEIARQGARDDASTAFIAMLFRAYFQPYICASARRF